MHESYQLLHRVGYVVLPNKIAVPKNIANECRSLFVQKKVTYTFNGTSGESNDKKRYMAKIESSTPLQKWIEKIRGVLQQHKIITVDLQYAYSSAYASVSGCSEQVPHSDYLRSSDFTELADCPKILHAAAIKKNDMLLYTKGSIKAVATIKNVHLDDFPYYYYTIQLPDGTEKQTTITYLSNLPETDDAAIARLNKIPVIVLTAIMDNTSIHIWENSHNWMRLHDDQSFEPPVEKKTIILDRGQICVLRGDVIHAGTAYTKENIRMYSFYDSFHVLSNQNKVYSIGNKTKWEKEIIASIS